jgi:hypothetical protein
MTAMRPRPVPRSRFSTATNTNAGCAAFELSTSAQAGLRAANPRIINFHFALQRLTPQVDHGAPEFMQYHPCSFVTS